MLPISSGKRASKAFSSYSVNPWRSEEITVSTPCFPILILDAKTGSSVSSDWSTEQMTSNNRDIYVNELQILLLSNKCVCSHDIKSGNTKKLLRIVYAFLLQHLCSNWYSWVNRVANNMNESIRAVISHSFNQCLHNASINVEKVITVIPRFLGTPAGMTTTSTSFKQLAHLTFPVKSRTREGVLQWLRSAATPFTLAIS